MNPCTRIARAITTAPQIGAVTPAIKISNPEQAGPKRGDVQIAFGTEPGKKVVADYNVTDVPVTLTTKGKGVEMSFDGKTKEGVGLRVNAKCSEVENLP